MKNPLPKEKKLEIAARIKQAMKENHISPTALANACKIKYISVNNWCTGKSMPRPDNFVVLANMVGKSVKYFFDGVEERGAEEDSDMGSLSEVGKALSIIADLMKEKSAQALTIDEQSKRIKDLESTVASLKAETEELKKKLLQYKRQGDPEEFRPESLRDIGAREITARSGTSQSSTNEEDIIDDTGEPRRNFR